MKRSKPEIISEILEICRDGANKTRIVYQANLNFRTINPYLNLLLKNHLIEASQGKYKTTEKGANLLGDLNQVNEKLSCNSSFSALPVQNQPG
jgi:predicted transcriptional regulator